MYLIENLLTWTKQALMDEDYELAMQLVEDALGELSSEGDGAGE